MKLKFGWIRGQNNRIDERKFVDAEIPFLNDKRVGIDTFIERMVSLGWTQLPESRAGGLRTVVFVNEPIAFPVPGPVRWVAFAPSHLGKQLFASFLGDKYNQDMLLGMRPDFVESIVFSRNGWTREHVTSNTLGMLWIMSAPDDDRLLMVQRVNHLKIPGDKQ